MVPELLREGAPRAKKALREDDAMVGPCLDWW
jgi:hypothetical protein